MALDFQSDHSATILFTICEVRINAGKEVIDHFPDVRKTILMPEIAILPKLRAFFLPKIQTKLSEVCRMKILPKHR
ncbi:MAG: hypothetical protein WCK18_01960 [Prolixibacteraceae bacterium]